RDAVADAADTLGVQVRRMFDPSLHGHPAFAHAPTGDLSVTERVSSRLLALPCANELEDWQLERIASVVQLAHGTVWRRGRGCAPGSVGRWRSRPPNGRIGVPATIVSGATGLLPGVNAPTAAPSPTVTPGSTTEPQPTSACFWKTTGSIVTLRR